MLIRLLAYLYATIWIVYWVWTHSPLKRPWWLKVLNAAAFWAFIGVPLLPLLLFLYSSTPLALVTGAAAALYVAHILWPMRPKRLPEPSPDAPRLRVMTSNLLKTNTDWSGIVETIRREAPDIVALQEVREGHVRALWHRLGDAYPYQQMNPGRDAEGMALLSKRPLRDVAVEMTAPDSSYWQRVRICYDGRPLCIMNVHPWRPQPRGHYVGPLRIMVNYDTSRRLRDMHILVQEASACTDEAIFLGDWNTTREGDAFRLLPRGWRDAYDEAGAGPAFTYPVRAHFFGLYLPFPLFRIDHVFVQGDLTVLSYRTASMPGSDHRYLVVDVALPPDGSPCR
jgi:endonuclease/exonuclease/phosphatase (EEP) superfamily protein YafD